MLNGLPPEAAVWRGKESSWSVSEEILHSILDRVLLQQGVKGRQLPDLRPGAKKTRGNVMSVSDFGAWSRRQEKQRKEGEQK